MENKIKNIINESINYDEFLTKIKNEFDTVKVTEDKIKIIGKYNEEYWMLREFCIEDIKTQIIFNQLKLNI